MKKIALLLSLSLSLYMNAQKIKINERSATQHTHINIKSEYVYFIISGLIETNGHTFNNDTITDKFIYHADLNEVMIYRQSDSLHKNIYVNRDCEDTKCKILHLQQKRVEVRTLYNYGTTTNEISVPNINHAVISLH